MILGIGVDLIDVPRIAEAIQKQRFLERVYTEAERFRIAECGEKTAAGFYAAKEAVAKALGTGFTGFGPQAVGIVHAESGAPRVELTGAALARFEQMGGRQILISISHLPEYATAFAVIEG